MPSPFDPVFWLIAAWVYAVYATAECDALTPENKVDPAPCLDGRDGIERKTTPTPRSKSWH